MNTAPRPSAQRPVARPAPTRKAPRPRSRRNLILAVVTGGVLLLGGIGWAVRDSPPRNRAAELRDIAPFATLYGAKGAWMARYGPDDPPKGDAAEQKSICEALASRVRAIRPGSVTILSADGLPLARCP